MSDAQQIKVVDAFDLDDELRSLLRPGDLVKDAAGRRHRLPRYFYEIPSHDAAVEIRLAPHFGLNEFILVDLKEAPRLQQFPRYIPCAVRMLAFFLEQFRGALNASVHIAVNGGYRSPAHRMSGGASTHMWATAADIYRIGSSILKTKELIERFNDVAEELSDDAVVLPYGHETGTTVDDHIHIDLGYLLVVPREISEDRMEVPQATQPRFAFEERRRRERRVAQPAAGSQKGQ